MTNEEGRVMNGCGRGVRRVYRHQKRSCCGQRSRWEAAKSGVSIATAERQSAGLRVVF